MDCGVWLNVEGTDWSTIVRFIGSKRTMVQSNSEIVTRYIHDYAKRYNEDLVYLPRS